MVVAYLVLHVVDSITGNFSAVFALFSPISGFSKFAIDHVLSRSMPISRPCTLSLMIYVVRTRTGNLGKCIRENHINSTDIINRNSDT